MRLVALAAVVTIAASVATAEEPIPETVTLIVTKAKEKRGETIQKLDDAAKQLENDLKNKRMSRDKRAKVAAKIKKARNEIASLKAVGIRFPNDINPMSPSVGDCGKLLLGATSLEVAQIIDGNTIHVIPRRSSVGQPTATGRSVSPARYGERLVIRGIDTVDLADGKRLTPDGAFVVAGTESYETAIGTKATIFVLEPFDLTKWEPAIKAELAKD